MENVYLAALAEIVPGLGRSHILETVRQLGGAEATFKATGEQLASLGVYSEKKIENFLLNRKNIDPLHLAEVCRQKGIKIVSYFDDEYPKSLKEIHDPPLALYVLGNLPEDAYSIGIVGSRLATAYGIKTARYYAKAMVAGDIPVISGGAVGIDSAAHAAVVEEDGVTIAVLGCGVDIVYPATNAQLFKGILKRGAIVSEYPPGTQPQARFFPARNRIIVGLSRGVIVCEAAIKSGALITAHCAADEQREVYAVPGNIFEPTSIGCHTLIQQGAHLIADAREIFLDREAFYQKLNRTGGQQNLFKNKEKVLPPKEINNPDLSSMSADGKKIYHLLGQGALSMDDLIEQSGMDFTQISIELLDLQVLGLVDTDQTQKYFRK